MVFKNNKKAMTLIELLLVVSLVSLVALAIYNCLSNGIKVWKAGQRAVIEEDIMIFFDKMASDLANACIFSKLKFDGSDYIFNIPTRVYIPADEQLKLEDGAYINQIGRVQYAYDAFRKTITRRSAGYGMSLYEEYGPTQVLVSNIERVVFSYIYIKDEEEIYSGELLDVLPQYVEVIVEYKDQNTLKTMKRFFDVPIGSI